MTSTRTREDSLASPGVTNAEIASVVSGGMSDAPEIPEAPNDRVVLPGGLVKGDQVYRTAQVRELNGSDEEALSRALKSGSILHFVDVLIERGTVSIGDLKADKDILKSLLLGDRDEIALAIRKATYGDEMVIEQWTCPACRALTDISFTLTDDVIERRTLADPSDRNFEVELRKGASALVRLPNGIDQDALFADDNWTTAQRNTVIISRCVITYTDPAGQTFNMAAFPSLALNFSIPDRMKIIKEITERQPGPRYNEVKFVHDGCQNEVTLALGARDLFRDLLLFL